jgi:hypothetical protein
MGNKVFPHISNELIGLSGDLRLDSFPGEHLMHLHLMGCRTEPLFFEQGHDQHDLIYLTKP